MHKYDVQAHEPSLLPDEFEWKLVWSDEFDGEQLDESKWDYRVSLMGKNNPSWLWRDGVFLDGKSNAVFKPVDKYGDIRCAQLQTGYNYLDGIPSVELGGWLRLADIKAS